MKTNKTKKQTQAKPKLTKSQTELKMLVNPTEEELRARVDLILKGEFREADLTKTVDQRLKEFQ